MAGAMMFLKGLWSKPGVWNVEDFDPDRVHDSDIKKLLQWYNILVKNGYTDFKAVLAPTEGDNVDDRQEQENA